jgi:putative ABC transport system permease protein
MSQLAHNLRLAVRNLRHQLAMAAILTLALGIGANSAIFSIVDAILITPPPFRDPGRLVVVWSVNSTMAATEGLGLKGPASNALFYDWQKASRSFAGLGLMQSDRQALTGQGEPVELGVTRVSGDFFRTLGAAAALGRPIDLSDDNLGKPNTAVLSYALWQHRFGGDRGVIGRTIVLGGAPYTVVGVMPPRFTFPLGGFEIPGPYGFTPETDVWAPIALTADNRRDREERSDVVIGRLRPGVTMAAAEAELKAHCARLAALYPQTDGGWSVSLQPLLDQMRGQLRTALIVLWAAVGLVLLIACVNVANLLLARAASRQKEIALRMAMGASRGQLIAQLLTESGVLALLGGAIGVALAEVALHAFSSSIPVGLAIVGGFSLNARAIVFTAALCLVASLLAGLAPALQMTRQDLAGSLREGTRAGAGTRASHRTRNILVAAEVALATLLLISAGLLMRSFIHLLDVNPGFRSAHLLSIEFAMPSDRYPMAQRLPFLERVVEKLRVLPGIDAAAITSDLPMDGDGGFRPFTIGGQAPRTAVRDQDLSQLALQRSAAPGYFETMRIPLLRGRLFTAADTATSQKVALIDDTMARTYLAGEDPIGKRLLLGKKAAYQYTIVGVVGSVREAGLLGDLQSQMYMVASQNPVMIGFLMRIVMHTAGDPVSVIPEVRTAVHQVDPTQPVSRIRTLDQMIAASVDKPRFSVMLLGFFAGLALVLAIVGIYGVTAYSISQRTRELGIRMALGAARGTVLRMVVMEAVRLACAGVLCGIAAAYVLTRVMASLLYGVSTTDPLTFVGVPLSLILTVLVATWLPGRKATGIQPVTALRID